MAYMIDEPSPFESLSVWKRFLDDVLLLDQGDQTVRAVAERARLIIQEKSRDA